MSEEVAFDFSEGIERVVVPVDWYQVRIANVEAKTSQSGNPMLSVMLRITGGVHADVPLFTNWMLKGKGSGILKGALRAFMGDDAVAETKGRIVPSELVGLVAEARVTQKVWTVEDGGDGEIQNRISKFRPATFVDGDGEVAGLFTG